MTLLSIIILFVVVGIVLYLINRFVPMDAKIKMLLNIVVIIILIIYLLRGLGFLDALNVKV